MKLEISEREAAQAYLIRTFELVKIFWEEAKQLFQTFSEIGIEEIFRIDRRAESEIMLAVVGQNLGTLKNYSSLFSREFHRKRRIEYWCMDGLKNLGLLSAESRYDSEFEGVRKYQEFQETSIDCQQNPFENISRHLLVLILPESGFRLLKDESEFSHLSLLQTFVFNFTQCAAKAFQFWDNLCRHFDLLSSPFPTEISFPTNGIFPKCRNGLLSAKFLEAPRLVEISPFRELVLFENDFPKKNAIDKKLISLIESAENGDPNAQFLLGKKLFLGEDGIPQNFGKALKWFFKSAQKNCVGSQIALGYFFKWGQGGLGENALEAARWFRKAAEQGSRLGERCLGTAFLFGYGEKQDFVEAKKFLEKAARKGDRVAQNHLGMMYFKGLGVARNFQKAFLWFSRAALRGNARAQRNLGVMYYNGNGVIRNFRKSFKWFLRSARSGFNEARFDVGTMFFEGKGTKRNYYHAWKWLKKYARESGSRKKKLKALKLARIAKNRIPQTIQNPSFLARISPWKVFLWGIVLTKIFSLL